VIVGNDDGQRLGLLRLLHRRALYRSLDHGYRPAVRLERGSVRTRITFVVLMAISIVFVVVLLAVNEPKGHEWLVAIAMVLIIGPISARTEFLVTSEAEKDGQPGFSMVYDATEIVRLACALLVPASLAWLFALPTTLFSCFIGRVPQTNPVPTRLMLSLISAAPWMVLLPAWNVSVRAVADQGGIGASIAAAAIGVLSFAGLTIVIDCLLYLFLGRGVPQPWYLGFSGHLLPIDFAGLVPVVLVLEEPFRVQLIALLPALGLVAVRVWVLEHFADRRRRALEQSLLARASSIAEEGRAALVRDLHDGPVQSLLALRLTVDDAARMKRPFALEEVRDGLDRSVEDLRRLLEQSRNHEGDLVDGLGTVVDALSPSFFRGITITGGDAVSLPDHVASVAYEIILEGARNAAQHADASHLQIDLRAAGTALQIDIADDGHGFAVDAPRRPGHLGLRVMRERAEGAGGEFYVNSAPGCGCVVRAILPLVPDPFAQRIY